MVMRVLIVAAESRKTKDRRFIILHEIDDVLDRSLRLFKADRSSLTSCLCQPSDCSCYSRVAILSGQFLSPFWIDASSSLKSGVPSRCSSFLDLQLPLFL